MTTKRKRKPFKLPEKIATLQLSGPWEGAEIDVNLSIGWAAYEAVGRWLAHFTEARTDGDDPAEIGAALREVAEIFVAHALRGWNIEDGNGPVPETAEGLLSLNDPSLMAAIVGGWIGAMGTVPDPLASGSSGSSPEPSTPTPDSPSPSPTS